MSTFSNLFSKEMKKGQNPFDAATAAYNDTIKSILGIPKGGLLGRFMSSKTGGKKMESSTGISSITSSSMRIVAKNSMSLPVIAKEMNIMRQNIQMMVKKQGLTPKNRSDASLSSTGQTSSIPPSSSKSSKGGFFESAGSTIKSVGGGLLSITSGIASGLFGVLGAAGSGFLGMFSSMSPLMMITSGYIISVLFRAIPFQKIGEDFKKIFGDILTGLSSFFGIDNMKEFFGMKEGEGFFQYIAKKLDETFKTSFFTDNLEKAGKILADTSDEASRFVRNAFNTVINYAIATIKTTTDLIGSLGKDVKGYLLMWLDSNRSELYTIVGATLGSVVGAFIPRIGSAAGGAIGAGIAKGVVGVDEFFKDRKIESYGGIDAGLAKTTSASMLITGLLDKNKPLEQYDDSLLSPLKNPQFYKELSKNTGKSFDYYKNRYIIGGTPEAMSKWLTEHLGDINSDLNMFETKKLISEGGPNALRDFNIRDSFYKNLGNAESDNPPITKNPTRISPVDNPKTPTGAQAYGAQRNNDLGKYEHGGVDYLGKIGDPVYAMQDGKVELRDQPNGLGKYIIIRGKDGSSTIYGHLNKPTVAVGSEVTYGQKIGEMGDSGNAKGTPQLHFEAYSGEPFKKSGRLDPIAFLEGRMLGAPTMQNTAADNKTNVISDVTTSTKENIIDPLVKKFDEMIAAFMAKDTNVVVNTSSESIPAEPYSEEQLSHYKLSGINF